MRVAKIKINLGKRPYRTLGAVITIWSFLISAVYIEPALSFTKEGISPPSKLDPIIKMEYTPNGPVPKDSKGYKNIKNEFKEDFSWVYISKAIAKALELRKGAGWLRGEMEGLEGLRQKSGLKHRLDLIEKRKSGFYVTYSNSNNKSQEVLHYFLEEGDADTSGYFALPLDTERTVYLEVISEEGYEKIQKWMVPVAFSTDGGCERQIIDAIKEARDKIDIAIYNFDNEKIFNALLNKKIKIRIMIDKSSLKKIKRMLKRENLKDSGLINYLRGLGIELKVDKRKNGLMHNKFMIVDDKLVMTGSYNWTSHSNENRENTVALSYIAAFQEYFDWLWGGQARSPPPARSPPGVKALFSPRGGCYDEIIKQIEKVKTAQISHPEYTQNIDIALFYFTDKKIARALFEAKEAGVETRIALDKRQKNLNYGVEKYLLFLEKEARKKVGDSLRKGGLTIRYHRISNGLMHNKFAIIGQNTLTGSFNWTQSAEKRNRENLIVLPFLVKDYLDEFERLWKDYESEAIISKIRPNNQFTQTPPSGLEQLETRPRLVDKGNIDKIKAANEAVVAQKSDYQDNAPVRGPPSDKSPFEGINFLVHFTNEKSRHLIEECGYLKEGITYVTDLYAYDPLTKKYVKDMNPEGVERFLVIEKGKGVYRLIFPRESVTLIKPPGGWFVEGTDAPQAILKQNFYLGKHRFERNPNK